MGYVPGTREDQRRILRSLCGRIREAHLAKDYPERDRLCKEHDALALRLLQPTEAEAT